MYFKRSYPIVNRAIALWHSSSEGREAAKFDAYGSNGVGC